MENLEHLDWRNDMDMMPIRNQGKCDSCWTIASTDLIYMICILQEVEWNELLSAQELLDHVHPAFPHIEHGNFIAAFDYIKNKTIARDVDHPYDGKRDPFSNLRNPRYKILGYGFVPRHDEEQLIDLLKKHPLGVGLRLNNKAVKNVDKDTILEWETGENKGFYHACILIGYGKQGNDYYWLLRMSWGIEWGHDGYGKLRRTPGHVPFKAYYPLIDPQMFKKKGKHH